MVTVCRYWWQNFSRDVCVWPSQCNETVINISNQPPIPFFSKIGDQNRFSFYFIWNKKSVILVKMLQVSIFKMSRRIVFIRQLDCHLANQKILSIVSIAHIMGKFVIPLAGIEKLVRRQLKTQIKTHLWTTMLQSSRKIWT